jgi:heat-inducible transcriptional repressor
MADLEARGYLSQPHTSAGRIPTAKGFRFYIDSLIGLKELTGSTKKMIADNYDNSLELDEVMKETSRILSKISHCAGIVLAPRLNCVALRHIKLIRIGSSDILVVLVSRLGTAQNRVVHMDEDLNQAELDKMSNYLSGVAKGLSLPQLREKIIEEMRKEKTLYNRLLSRAMKLGMEVLTESRKDDVYVDGRLNILEQPEFSEDARKLKKIFKAFEEKNLLIRLLDKSIGSKDVQVDIGFENGSDGIEGCSIVKAPYGNKENTLGTLGVIGPVRMNYPLVIPLVRYTADMLGEILERRRGLGMDKSLSI